MRVGLMVPPDYPLGRIVALAARAEELGFDFLGSGEHVFFHVPTSNAFVALAAAAGGTQRIRLVSAATLLPVYPAALAAKMIATLDGISGGRFELGVGIGGEFPAELRACGVEPAERGARTDESLEVLAALFTGAPVHHDGRCVQIDGQRLDPAPVRVPIWVGGRRSAAIRRAARFGDVWMPYLVSPDQLTAGLAGVREAAAGHGRGAEAVRGALLCWSYAHPDGDRARRVALARMGRVYQQDFAAVADRYLPAGTPAEVATRLAEYAAAGAETVLFSPACPYEDVDAAAELFIREVWPAVVSP